MKQFIEMYQQLTEEQKQSIFTTEQIAIIEQQISYIKLFTNTEFRAVVQTMVANALYKKYNEQ